MDGRCLVPISVDSNLFRTRFFLPALRPLLERHSELVFLVADQIQLYNKAALVRSPSELVEVLKTFRSRNRYLEERRAWLRRIFECLRQETSRVPDWSVLGVDGLVDGSFYEIFKAVVIMYQTVGGFQRDMIAAANSHVMRYTSPSNRKQQTHLAICYLLEELAINLRLRVCEQIFHEYYVGENLEPLVKLYFGAYGVTVDELAGRPPSPEPFRFYRYAITVDGPSWGLITCAERPPSGQEV